MPRLAGRCGLELEDDESVMLTSGVDRESALRAVPDGCVAVHARHSAFVGGAAGDDVVHEAAVAGKTCLLQNSRVVGLDHDGLVKILKREALRVVVTVERLGHELGQKRVRQVTVGAGGDDVVARLHPRVVLGVHDVAVRACLGISREIREALGVDERE